jgi:hypothetical protein
LLAPSFNLYAVVARVPDLAITIDGLETKMSQHHLITYRRKGIRPAIQRLEAPPVEFRGSGEEFRGETRRKGHEEDSDSAGPSTLGHSEALEQECAKDRFQAFSG